MLKITPVDTRARLYSIENLVSDSVAQSIQAQAWLRMPQHPGPGQETWARQLVDSCAATQEFDRAIGSAVAVINQQLGTRFSTPTGSSWWVDLPGFQVNMHCDNARVTTALHMYWAAPSQEYGTAFYSDSDPTRDFAGCDPDQLDLVHQFASCANTGYLMRNEPDPESGQLPRLWHGMFNPVPQGQFRLSSYTILKE